MRRHNFRLPFIMAPIFVAIFSLYGCDSDDDKDAKTGKEITAAEGFLERKALLFEHCKAANGPDDGGRFGNVCAVKSGKAPFASQIREMLAKIYRRDDTSDFDFNSIIRMLWIDKETGALPDDLREEMKQAALDFKYWLDEPGPDTMTWWSENHQILFHTAELLVGLLYPEEVFSNSGMTGLEHVEHARPLLHRWLDFRGKFGFSEFHSNVYYNEDMPALLNLVDFADSESLRTKAEMTLDILYLDMIGNYYKGYFATGHGRTYPDRKVNDTGLSDSTRDAAYLLGLSTVDDINTLSTDNFTSVFMVTSDHYAPPDILEEIAYATRNSFHHQSRDSINISEGPDYGIGYTDWNDIMFWWGMTGYVAPEVIMGTFDMVEHFDMWQGDTWKDLQFIRPLVGSDIIYNYSSQFAPMSRGVALEAANTYTWRTPYYQMSGIQDFKPSSWTAQVHIWQATIDAETYVFTTYPGGSDGDYMGGLWTGGFVPRATFHENVGVIQYWRPELGAVEELLSAAEDAGFGFEFVDYSHAFFPKNRFDQVREEGNWVMGSKGDSYVALYSQTPATWTTENDYELMADARENVWIIELGDVETFASFEDFVSAIITAEVRIGEKVEYVSPSLGQIEVGRTGPMTVAGEEVNIGPYERMENSYINSRFGTLVHEVNLGSRKLVLDFENSSLLEY